MSELGRGRSAADSSGRTKFKGRPDNHIKGMYRCWYRSRPACYPMITFGEPGAQGAGIQGAGVKTSEAVVVAAITAGLVGALHIPKRGILAAGIKSIIVAAGR